MFVPTIAVGLLRARDGIAVGRFVPLLMLLNSRRGDRAHTRRCSPAGSACC